MILFLKKENICCYVVAAQAFDRRVFEASNDLIAP